MTTTLLHPISLKAIAIMKESEGAIAYSVMAEKLDLDEIATLIHLDGLVAKGPARNSEELVQVGEKYERGFSLVPEGIEAALKEIDGLLAPLRE